jgi:nitrite reductase (NO-forming)
MSDHNLSARLWATAALVAVPLASSSDLGWWLPLHIALLGAMTQAIAGGQPMFSTTLGLSRGPSRRLTVTQLGLLNLAAISVIAGRLWDSKTAFATGVAIFVCVIGYVTWQVHAMWKRSVNRRFATTGTFYGLAGTCLLLGATIGGALGIGAFNDGTSYIAHRGVHMILNVYGWAGLTIVGTAITLLPTILHVRSPDLRYVKTAPWLMFGGLLLVSTGATTSVELMAAFGMAMYVAGLIAFGAYLKTVLTIPSRRKIPTAAFHLVSAQAWAFITAMALVSALAQGESGMTRDLVVVGGAGGFALQALLGAWSFLLPSTRPPVPQRRRVELVAMELGGRSQVVAYNFGLILILVGLRTAFEVSITGIVLSWTAAAWALTKSWVFPFLSRLESVERLSAEWWTDPQPHVK